MQPPHQQLPQDLTTALLELSRALNARRIRYALIGGLAAGFRGRPRFTEDVDLLLHVPQLVLPGLLEDLQRAGFDFDLEGVIQEWNQRHTALLRYHGVPVDWLKPVLPTLEHVIERASEEEWLGERIRVACTEDLIVMKLLAFRSQDLIDVQNLLAANRGQLDLQSVRRDLRDVVPDDDGRQQRLEELIRDYYVTVPED